MLQRSTGRQEPRFLPSTVQAVFPPEMHWDVVAAEARADLPVLVWFFFSSFFAAVYLRVIADDFSYHSRAGWIEDTDLQDAQDESCIKLTV